MTRAVIRNPGAGRCVAVFGDVYRFLATGKETDGKYSHSTLKEQTMDIIEIPFNHFLGIRRADGYPGHLLRLDDSPTYQNHLGTVHASVQLALAEASSGECLLQQFPDLAAGVLSVVRKLEAKFKNPLKGMILSRATIRPQDADKLADDLLTKGRGFIVVAVEVVGADGVVGLTSTIEWFVQRQSPQLS